MGVSLRDLGAHQLKDFDQPERLVQLVIEGLANDFLPRTSLDTRVALPREVTSFVGRRQEIDALTALMTTSRLVTLTGPGGTGKTRLAIRVAAEVGDGFRDGVQFVDLSALTDTTLVGPTIARSLGLREDASRSMTESLKDHLRPRQILLVLDNFEQLLPAGGLIEELLADAAGLRVLATSRSALHVYGEQEFPVPPLAVPTAGEQLDQDVLSGFAAVALFIDRARAVKPTFALTPTNASAVADICLRLDGLPLAIELVASRIRMLEPAEILTRLMDRLPVLGAGGSGVPARQRTLQDAIDWSYDLLPAPEQALFARLAIFSGGCTLESADDVCNPRGELELDTLDGIANLIDRSLMRQTGDSGRSRYQMLQTIRDYGLDRLTTGGTMTTIGRRHSAYFRDLGEIAESHFLGPDQAEWLDRFEAEADNVRGALRRSSESGDPETGLRLASAIWRFWLQRGYLREGRTWLETLLAMEPEGSPAVRAKAYTALGGLTYWLSDVEATEDAYEAAVRLLRGTGDRYAEARATYDLAFVPVMRGDHEEARRRLGASLALAEEAGRADVVALSQHSLGLVMTVDGDPLAGLAYQEASLAFFQESGDRFQTAWSLSGIGLALAFLGRRAEARARYIESLRLHAEAMNLPGIGAALEVLATLESTGEHHEHAVRLAAAVEALRSKTGASAPLMFTHAIDVVSPARRALGDAAVDATQGEGRRMTVDEMVDYASGLDV